MELKLTVLFSFFMLWKPIQAQDDNVDACPVGTLTMAGAANAEVIVQAWKETYSKTCPDFDINTEGGSYPLGAARVCGNHPVYDAVDLAGMYGHFFDPQASTENKWSYNCKSSDRETILVSHYRSECVQPLLRTFMDCLSLFLSVL